MFNTVKEIIAEELGIDSAEIDEDSRLMEDLGADSLEIVDMLMAIEENFGVTVSDEEAMTLVTVRDVAELIESKL